MTILGTDKVPLRVAIVGSGPSGFYAAEALLKSSHAVSVDMYERLPVPYGLVRSGVAPDHAKLKQVIDVYAKIAEQPGFSFFGNVTIGQDLGLAELRQSYHAVIFACGAEADRSLGIPGENLPGSHAATEFVGWYNGHPDFRDREFDFSTETAVVIGQGNVAADVARILAKSTDELARTDIAAHALEALAGSRIRDIHVVGRRGPVQAKFTSKELKEFGELQHATPVVETAALELNEASKRELEDAANSGARRNYDIFCSFAGRHAGSAARRVVFSFLKSPVAIHGSTRVEAIELEDNELTGSPGGQSARGTGRRSILPAGLIFRSIGYRGRPLPDVPFDERRGVIPNDDGRVLDGREILPQVYAAGWIKRGPTGIIGTNRADSVATVASLMKDLPKLPTDDMKRGAEGICARLNERGIRWVSFADWKVIDEAEIKRGKPHNKPREKFTTIPEMLDCL